MESDAVQGYRKKIRAHTRLVTRRTFDLGEASGEPDTKRSSNISRQRTAAYQGILLPGISCCGCVDREPGTRRYYCCSRTLDLQKNHDLQISPTKIFPVEIKNKNLVCR